MTGEDIDYFAPCSWYFSLFVPNTTASLQRSRLAKFAMAITRVFTFSFLGLTGIILHMVRFYNGSVVNLMEDIILVCYYFVHISYISLYSINPEAGILVIRDMYRDFPKPPHLESMRKWEQKLCDYLLTTLFVVVTGAMIVANWDTSQCSSTMHTPMGYRSCGFIVPMWFPLVLELEPVRLLLVLLHYIQLLVTDLIIPMFGVNFSIMVHHLIVGCETLISLLEDVDQQPTDLAKRNRLVTFVKLHSNFLESLSLYIRSVRPYTLITFIYGVIFEAVCIIKTIYMGPSIIIMTILLGWCFAISFLMILSQQLTNKSVELCEAVYNLRWYDMDKESKSLVLFILMRTQKSMLIKNDFTDMSHSALLSAMKATYSYTTTMSQTVHTN